MGWDGLGNWNRLYSWVTDAGLGIDITASRMDGDTDDITSNGLGNCLTRDGQGKATTNLPMAGFRHTGVGNGQARTDYAALGQDQDSSAKWGGTSTGAAGVFAITLTPAITAYASGQVFTFKTHQAAAGADTININTVGALAITKGNGAATVANDFGSGQLIAVAIDSVNSRAILLNTPVTLPGIVLTNPTVSGGTFSSPSLTGTPVTVTPAVSDSSQQIANTAWVRGYVPPMNLSMVHAAVFGTQLSPGV